MPTMRVCNLLTTTVRRTNNTQAMGRFTFFMMIYLLYKSFIKFPMRASILLCLCASAVLGIWDLSLPGAGVPI